MSTIAAPSSPSASLAGRAVVALLLLVGFYALAIGIAAGLLGLVYLMVASGGRLPLKLLLVAVVAAGVILWSILPRPDAFEPPGPRLAPEKHPRLFAALRKVAEATGQPMPAEVYLVPDLNAWVSSRGGVMGLGSRRIMGLGLPLLQILSVAELKAVLAHEFGHYHGGDVKLGPWIYQTRAAIGRTITTLHQAESTVMHLPFEWYGSMFLRVTHGISRHQEFQADALAARVVGPGPLVAGLKRIHGAALAYDAYLHSELAPVLKAGFRPPMAEGFQRFVSAKRLSEQIDAAVDEELRSGQTDPFDTHPALPERIAAVEALRTQAPLDPGSPSDDAPAIGLLEDLPSVERELLGHLLVDPSKVVDGEAIEWSDVGRRVYAGLSQKAAEHHAKSFQGLTAGTIPGDVPTLAWHANKALPELASRPAAERAVIAAQLLAQILAHRLVEAGWTLEAMPGEPVVAVRGDERFSPAPQLVALARGELDQAAWRAECERLGIADLAL